MTKILAYQCPLEGGHAVYRARTLLAIYGGYDFLDDDPSNCGAKALQKKGENRSKFVSKQGDQYRRYTMAGSS